MCRQRVETEPPFLLIAMLLHKTLRPVIKKPLGPYPVASHAWRRPQLMGDTSILKMKHRVDALGAHSVPHRLRAVRSLWAPSPHSSSRQQSPHLPP